MIRILNLAKSHNLRPSEVLCISDSYTAFCFDEACDYIVNQLRDGKNIIWEHKGKTKTGTIMPSDFYKSLGVTI